MCVCGQWNCRYGCTCVVSGTVGMCVHVWLVEL